MDKSNLANTYWWWKFGWREGWKPDSMARFGWKVNIKSIQDEDESSKLVGSLINWCSSRLHVKTSRLGPSNDAMSFLNQVWLLALKSPRATVKKGFFLLISSRFNSKMFIIFSKIVMSLTWWPIKYNKTTEIFTNYKCKVNVNILYLVPSKAMKFCNKLCVHHHVLY